MKRDSRGLSRDWSEAARKRKLEEQNARREKRARRIADFLKEHLTIRVQEKSDYGYGGRSDKSIEVSLLLDGEVISKDSVSLPRSE